MNGPERMDLLTRLLFSWLGAHVVLALVAIYADLMFVVPTLRDRQEAWLDVVKAKDPAAWAAITGQPVFQVLDWICVPLDFLNNWWFMAVPAGFGLVSVLLWAGKKVSRPVQVLALGGTASVATLLAFGVLLATGVSGTVLIANWRP